MKNVLDLNAKLQENLEYLVDAYDFLIKNVIRLEDELKKAQHDKRNMSKKLDDVLAFPVHFAQDKHDIGCDESAASNIKPIFVEKNQKKMKELVRTSKVTKISQAPSPSAKVSEVIPFDAYMHKLAQPFWCKYCNKHRHIRE